jgi:hypothetical protein
LKPAPTNTAAIETKPTARPSCNVITAHHGIASPRDVGVSERANKVVKTERGSDQAPGIERRAEQNTRCNVKNFENSSILLKLVCNRKYSVPFNFHKESKVRSCNFSQKKTDINSSGAFVLQVSHSG